MLQALIEIDQKLFLILNGCHAPWLDPWMWRFSKTTFWIPVYALLLYSLFKKYGAKHLLIIVLFTTLLITLSDKLSVLLFKETVQRLRPSHEPLLEGRVHLLNDPVSGNIYKGGLYGYFSSHASNMFAVGVYYLILMRPHRLWIVVSVLLWASLGAYSRIYQGVHYPGDILSGAIFGGLLGWMLSALCKKVLKKFPNT